jgi:hypothetical protein
MTLNPHWGPISWGIAAGLAAGVLAMLWITIALLTGDGATAKVLYPALLFLLPVLAIGAAAGYCAGLAVLAVRGRTSRGQRPSQPE